MRRGSGCADARRKASDSCKNSGSGEPGAETGSSRRPLARILQALRRGTAAAGVALVAATPCLAQEANADGLVGGFLAPGEVFYLSFSAFLIGGGMLAAVYLLRRRQEVAAENEALKAALAEARGIAEQRGALLAADGERILVFNGPGGAADIVGTLDPALGVPVDPQRFLAFDTWLPPDVARQLPARIETLRAEAAAFTLSADLPRGAIIEITGKPLGGEAVVRFTPLKGLREAQAALKADHARAAATIATLQSLFDAAPLPVWLRSRDRRLAWVNAAYGRAVDAPDPEAALKNGAEFLGEADRAAIAARIEAGGTFDDKLSTVVDNDRRTFHVVDVAGPFGSAGLAVDVSEAEEARRVLAQTLANHADTLDQLTTAVARFDDRTQITYHNAAFQKLFGLSSAYLGSKPDHVSMMDMLQSRGTLPMDRPLRELKNEVLAAYRATAPVELMWHLSGGRTLRVFANPQPQGGATWVFEDLTEKIELESRLNSLVRLQRETLDYLKEAVAVFGQDARLRLFNPAFAEMWELSTEFLDTKPRIQKIAESAPGRIAADTGAEAGGAAAWDRFVLAVTAMDEGPRESEAGTLEFGDGRVYSFGIVPLPGGQTMLTFADISTARQAERMLRERNEALEQADQIKTDFVQHVNYELRSPLTNIIGFSALLRSPDTGPLNTRQSEYLDYISSSTAALLTIVNDILDLATLDAGIMDLELGEVEIAKSVEQAAEGVRDRLLESGVDLQLDVDGAGRTMIADGHRLTQVLFNLLANAVNFAPAGSTVTLSARREAGDVVFRVSDRGQGILPAQLAKIFERFESNPAGGRRSGAGLGLSIVKSFVDLHGGSVTVDSGIGRGTQIVCRFPADPNAPAPPPSRGNKPNPADRSDKGDGLPRAAE